MSSSIITSYAVATLDTKVDGKFIYFAYTEGYEKNVFPHIATWSLIAIGEYDHCWRSIIRSAAYCEHGATQSKSGRDITPLAYVDAWRKAFRNVGRLSQTEFTLKFGSGFNEVKTDFYDHFSLVFATNGVSIDKQCRLNLNNPLVLKSIVDLFTNPLKIPVPGSYWPLSYYYFEVLSDIPRDRSSDFPLLEANVNHVNQKSNLFESLDVEVFAIGNSNGDLVLLVNDKLLVFGQSYKLIFTFLIEFAIEHEISRHGSFHDLYRQLQQLLKEPIDIPSGSMFILRKPNENATKWTHEDFNECVTLADVIHDENHISLDARIRSDLYAFARYPIDLMKLNINRNLMTPALTAQKQISLLV